MKKYLFIISIIFAVLVIVLAFYPLIKSPIISLGWSTIFIASIPGILTLIATVTALKNRIWGGIMFLILAIVFSYFIYSKLLSNDYLIIAGLFLMTGILFLFSLKKELPSLDKTQTYQF